MGIVALPSICSAGVLPWWGVANTLLSMVVLGSAAGLVALHAPKDAAREAAPGFFEALCGQGILSAVAILLLLLPNFALTVAAAVTASPLCHAIVPLLLGAVALKLLGFPERHASPGRFDFSILHSHSLWHINVCCVQLVYLTVLLTALGRI